MTTNLRSTIDAQVSWTWRDQEVASAIVDSNRLHFVQNLADGAEASQADAVWHAEDQVVPAGGSVALELDALEKDLFGDTITIALVGIRCLMIANKNSAGSGYLLIGGASTDQWYEPFGSEGDTLKIMPGGALLLANPLSGWSVGAGAAALKIAAPGPSVTFDITILGTVSAESSSS